MPTRRTLLTAAPLSASAALLAGCTEASAPRTPSQTDSSTSAAAPSPQSSTLTTAPSPGQTHTVRYGSAHPDQFAELTVPQGRSAGVAVVIHGGFWRAEYDRTLGQPLAASLVTHGWTAWNLEYRRGTRGGVPPATFDDIAAGIDALADVPGLDTSKVVTIGHSAGGHLAVWATTRQRDARWARGAVRLTAAISQAGVLDLDAAHTQGLGGGAVEALLGHPPTNADRRRYDPIENAPADVPVWAIHCRGDNIVPPSQSKDYVSRARASDGRATYEEFAGDHFSVIDPQHPSWQRVLKILDGV